MRSWTFISNHGAVLAYISNHKSVAARKIGKDLCLAERTVMRIIDDLEAGGYIERRREGRQNAYVINHHCPFQIPGGFEGLVGELLGVLSGRSRADMSTSENIRNRCGEFGRPGLQSSSTLETSLVE